MHIYIYDPDSQSKYKVVGAKYSIIIDNGEFCLQVVNDEDHLSIKPIDRKTFLENNKGSISSEYYQ